MPSVPKPFVLAITAGDSINYKGSNYPISNVAAGVDDGNGNTTYVLTLTGAPVSTITVSAKNTVASSQTGATGGTGPTLWVQTANA